MNFREYLKTNEAMRYREVPFKNLQIGMIFTLKGHQNFEGKYHKWQIISKNEYEIFKDPKKKNDEMIKRYSGKKFKIDPKEIVTIDKQDLGYNNG